MDKWKIGDKDKRSAHAKMSTESLADPKMEEQNLQSVTAPVLSSPKKQDVSNLASRQVNSISTSPIKAYVSQKGEAEQYEYKSNGIRVNKYCGPQQRKIAKALRNIMGSMAQRSLTKGN